MALPAGVKKANLTFSVPIDDAGNPVVGGKVTILAALDRVWSATGDLVLAANIVVQLDGAKVVPLAATDQPGFIDAAGQPVVNWTLDAVVDIPGRPGGRQLVTFALPTGGVDGLVVDFDRLVPVEQSSGQVVAVTVVTSVNGESGPAVILDAVDVGALPSNAPAVLKNPSANAVPFRVRNVADTGDVFSVSTVTGSITAAASITSGAAINSATALTAAQNDNNAIALTGANAGIRFGGTGGQTYIARQASQIIQTDSYIRFRSLATGSRAAASSVGSGGMYFDTTLGKPVWSDGTNWRDAMGNIV